ncbi:CBS domain-containing protein [Streptomyces buecherae]|uniref:CBS domain-containing protein n=1 Tax=Streptomyces buecherae TaxID=2763006 RepID=A0A7H8N2B1_9ACTN|nr:CBS domain-containing protein [Streptomyces buecherae]QKW48634.1 CBS domain-containing protein [Streptomyces buecherae]
MQHRKIGHVMTSDVVRVPENATFREVAELLARHRISGLPVVDADDRVIGVVSETDLMRRQSDHDTRPRRWLPALTARARAAREAAGKAHAMTARELMSRPAVCAHPQETVVDAARTMAHHRIKRLPVTDEENRLVGIVTRHDLLGVFLRPDAELRAEVIDEVLVGTLWLAPQTIRVSVADGIVKLQGRMEKKSEIDIAVRMTGQIDGVLAVVNHLTFRVDDSRLRLDDRTLHGVADDWMRKL